MNEFNMKRLLTTVFFAMAASLSAPTFAAGPLVNADSLKQNDVVNGPIKIGRRVIAIPAGNWQLVSRTEKNPSTDGVTVLPALVTLNFQEIANGRISRWLEVAATSNSSARLNWLDEPCKNKGDSFSIKDRKRGLDDQFCTRVGYTSAFIDGSRGDTFQSWAEEIKKKGIGYSPEMPFVMVTRYTPYDYLRMSVHFDPALSGIASSNNARRKHNDWNGKTLAEHPEQLKFYQAMEAWSPTFAAAVQRAFDGDQSLTARDFGEPQLPVKK